jgi:hypothetical protein
VSRRPLRRRLATSLAAAALVAGCSGGDNTDDVAIDEPSASEPTIVDESASEPTIVDESDDPETSGSESPSTSPTTTTEPVAEPDLEASLPLPDTAAIVQTTVISGGGARPLLGWEPVEGAASYIVVVFTADGDPYWSAVTDQAEIYVGGPVQIPDDNDGPRVADGYTWVVYADDADGALLASSPQRPISP